MFSQSNRNYYLGILETKAALWPENEYLSPDDSTRKKILRVLFRFQNDKWYSLENDIADSTLYPSEASWIIAFDGKKIGQFSSYKAPLRFNESSWTFPRDAYHIPRSKYLPTIGVPTMEFSGWVGIAHPRPLVAISDTNFSDPERWKPFTPKEIEISKLQTIYNNHFQIYRESWVDTVEISKLEYGKSYINSKSDKLLQLGMVDTVNGEEYLSNRIWIFESSSGEIIDLSKAIDFPFRGGGDSETSELYLVDAGDYDNDGYSDVVFWIERYNGNGYALFYNNFSGYVSFEWRYH